ncbi:ABC-2 type transporter [Denitrovibrio acetiphilus DSM 12809]|uniref:Transport permease protein n=1 Tax=Denitrovibrio acetiphilus (strain DSM 12809 / NBRC 114555 / N2460) TaxID=522772 RepID=D4H580_DENA2|nr:ABC transporter permease [Denitrovibrio acetiphilus]ADD69436.1 ABC-2 type transporter [Denitrovibrio acetiphilus DSM 12809]
MGSLLKQIISYRMFIISSIKSDFKIRTARSKLGFLWIVIHPLVQVLVYALILSNVMAAKLPGIDNKYAYAIYLMAGILGWTMFNEVLMRCVGIFLDNANYVKKLVFPKVVLPIIVAGVSLINMSILLVCTIGIFLLLGFVPGINIFWLPLLLAITLLLAISVGLVLGILNVFVRDVGQIVQVLLQFWFWLTPIVYMRSIIPENLRYVLNFNPLVPIIESFQNVILLNEKPMFVPLAIISAASFALLIFGLFLYKKASPEMVDVL